MLRAARTIARSHPLGRFANPLLGCETGWKTGDRFGLNPVILMRNGQMRTRRKSFLRLLPATLAVMFSLVVATAAPPSSPTAEPDREASTSEAELARYAGSWQVVTIEANGTVSAETSRVIVVDNRPDGSWTLTVDGQEIASGTNSLDPLAVPKAIDITITEGQGSGSVLRGIYELSDQTRRLCFRGGTGWRPREFSGAAGSDSVLVTFQRR